MGLAGLPVKLLHKIARRISQSAVKLSWHIALEVSGWEPRQCSDPHEKVKRGTLVNAKDELKKQFETRKKIFNNLIFI